MIRVYWGLDAIDACRFALKHQLYHPGWCLRGFYEEVENSLSSYSKTAISETRISIATSRGQAQGAALCFKNHVACYINSAYRRRGLGKELVLAIGPGDEIVAGEGISGSRQFWEDCGVQCTDYWDDRRRAYERKIAQDLEIERKEREEYRYSAVEDL